MKDMALYWQSIVRDEEKGCMAHIIKFVLRMLSLVYGLIVRIMVLGYTKGFFKRSVLPVKVLSIGNIVLGGSGKTPLIEWVARCYLSKGIVPAILTRGYSLKKGMFDEARLLEKELEGVHVAIGRDRFTQGMKVLEQNTVDVFIVDDGFQHWALHRDLDVVTIDSTLPFGCGGVIPRGFLREPLSALTRADVFVLTKVDLAREKIGWICERLRAINPSATLVESIHEPQRFVNARDSRDQKALSWIDGKTIACISAIGSPDSFERALIHLEANIEKSFIFRDHHVYSEKDAVMINQYCQEHHIFTLVTTAKDIVKLNQYLTCFNESMRIFVLEMQLSIIKGKEDFEKRVFSILDR